MNKEARETPMIMPKEAIQFEIAKNRVLIPEHSINIELLNASHARELAALYKNAYQRGDFFGSRYDNLSSQIFNPEWIKEEIENPDSVWIVFSRGNELVGATALVAEGKPYQRYSEVNIDETQIDPKGRGMRIMDHYFRRVVPMLKKLGIDITTEFVLTPPSKGLRRTLQTELGMTALGIHPNILIHRFDGNQKSEISGAIYNSLTPKKATIIPPFAQILDIVRHQLPVLPEPEIVALKDIDVTLSRYAADRYSEFFVDANNPEKQWQAIIEGFMPVKYDPKKHIFTVAKFPITKPDLGFVIDEQIKSNTELVAYLNARLYPKLEDSV